MSDVGSTPPTNNDSVSLLDLISALARHWRFVVRVTAGGVFLIVGYSIISLLLPSSSPWNVLPNVYRPQAKVLLLEDSRSVGSFSGADPLQQLLGANLKNSNSAALAEELLGGRVIQDQIISQFNFLERYDFTNNARAKARKLVKKSLKYEYNVDASILTMFYKAIDPEFATAVLAYTLELLEAEFRALTMENVRLKKRHLETRLDVVEGDRTTAQNRIVEFFEKYGFVDVEGQVYEVATLVAGYKRELLSLEIELQSKLDFLPVDDPSVLLLQRKIIVLRQVLDELHTGFNTFSDQTVPLHALPALSADYINLQGDLQIQEQIYALLRQEYELVRVDETDPARTFQIVEPVEVPESKHWPSRSLICVIGSFTVFLLSVLLVFLLEYVARLRIDPVEGAKLAAIREQFLGGRKSVSNCESD